MTDIIKQALLGTDATGSDYHSLMRSVTVHSMRQAAGYVAPVMDTDKDLWQHKLDGSKVLIETDVRAWIDAWYEVMDDIIDVLTHDEMLAVWSIDIPSWNKNREFIEGVINRANIRRVPQFWEYVFSQKHPDYFVPQSFSFLPEYPRNEAELMALYEKYGVIP
jgi:hypothetical protein